VATYLIPGIGLVQDGESGNQVLLPGGLYSEQNSGAVEPPTEIRELKLGDVQIERLYLGDIQILTVYLGDTKVYGDA